ncbi:hypothetical protein [Massilia litorea]|uniref:Uncharacterized protein n=1 Tax=Massilia litorea TaxID=2769491 RepID=A0A7L9U277_9BURK|nr:hypothetical protein [Massilia litorea]QOL48305.1 hypothetical protein LPB04_15095 [Massilia litorea]
MFRPLVAPVFIADPGDGNVQHRGIGLGLPAVRLVVLHPVHRFYRKKDRHIPFDASFHAMCGSRQSRLAEERITMPAHRAWCKPLKKKRTPDRFPVSPEFPLTKKKSS